MVKSGLIIGGVMLVLGTVFGFLFPLCIPCLALFAGAGAGYLAGMFDKPTGGTGGSAKAGAGAGAIGGAGALIGHIVGGMATALVYGPEASVELMRQFGVDVPASAATGGVGFYAGAFGAACCFGLVEVALMAGLGALGGLLWYQMTGKNRAGGTPPSPGMPA
jgi:hypothetical protein